ncbi:hypothetical protein [Vibrio diazotrophicus]|uniref:hypothetical protein n=1 Tax=Vibrio diazotrophicus TaxID=685 RepID=UPI000C9E5D3D|nr:hypothetical protein [Vibrio diazotrophicus]PNH94608.1 hypothetical protein C1M59_00790 [Vibrio diazotrophicus]
MKLLRSDLALSVLTVVIPVIFQLTFIWFASNNIEKDSYGTFVIVNGLVLALSQLFTAMPVQVVNRFYNVQQDKIQFINEMRVCTYFLSLISIVLLLLVTLCYKKYFTIGLISICVIYIFSNVSSIVFQQIFLIDLNRVEYFRIKIIDGIAKFISPIVGYIAFPKLEGIITGVIVGQLFLYLYLEYKLSIFPRFIVFDKEKISNYLKFSYPVVFSSLASWIIVFSDRLFIEYFLGVDDVAWYSLLVQLAGFAQILNVLYTIYVTPAVLKVYESSSIDGFKLLDVYLKKYAILLLCLLLAFAFIPDGFFEIVLGNNFFSADNRKDVFILIVISVFMTVYQTALSLYFVLLKKLHVHAMFFLLCALINFILNFYIDIYGVMAAAVATLISYAILNILILMWKQNARRN